MIARIIGSRRSRNGVLAPLAALAAALSVFFVLVFRDQTLATVAESVRIKYTVGPTISWYQDFLRYYFLTVEEQPEASLTRRFAVLVMLLCMFAMLVVLLRKGQLAGGLRSGMAVDRQHRPGPAPADVHPHEGAVQFGAFAGLAAALSAVTALRLRHRRPAQPAQPRPLCHGTVVRRRAVDIGMERLVLRGQLRRAVV